MKRTFCLIVILCLLLSLLSGCAGSLPSLPPLPGTETTEPPQESAAAEEETVAATAEPVAVELPEALELSFALPAAESAEDLAYYCSGADEFDCAFVYPSYCSSWVEKGAIRFNPSWFFARMFFTSVLRGDENAPDELLDLLETGKWGTYAEDGTVGTGWTALRALHLKYDTWRRWVAWETPERFYLLYGSCFDGREEVVVEIFETIAASFRTGEELLASAPGNGTLLRQEDGFLLFFDGAELAGGSAPCVRLKLRAVNGGPDEAGLAVNAYAADGSTFPFEEQLSVPAGEDWTWTLTLPLIPEEGGGPFESIGFFVTARGDDGGTLFELPVRIELQR